MAVDDLAKTSNDAVELLSFTTADQSYALQLMSVREIRGWVKPTPLPHAPSFMRGVINLRGTVLPIVDLAARLGLPATEETGRNVIIVVDVAGDAQGLLVDAVSDILEIARADMQPPPDLQGMGNAQFIDALTIVEDRMIRILNLTELLPEHNEAAA